MSEDYTTGFPVTPSVSVTSEQETAFDELFSQCCPEDQKYASVQSVVAAIRGIRKEGDEDSGMELLCSMLHARAADGQIDKAAYKKVIGQWIRSMTDTPASGGAPTMMTSSPIRSYSATMPLQTSQDFSTPQGLHFYSHESLEADGGGGSSLADSFDPAELQQNVERLKSENFRLREHQSHIELHCEQREESLKKFLQEKGAMEKKLRALMQQLQQKEEERGDLSQQVAERDCTNDILNRRLQEVEHERATLYTDLSEVRQQLAESHATIHQLESMVGELQALQEEKERRLGDLHSNLEELEERLSSVVEEKEELNGQLCSVKEHNVSLQQETKQMEQELEATKAELRTRSFLASPPALSSTPLGLASHTTGIGRHKSIMEEIQDTDTPPGDKPPPTRPVDLVDSLEQSTGSSLEVSQLSLESSLMEESTSNFQHYKDGAMQQLQDLLGLNSSFSLREHPSLRVFSSQDVTGADPKWEDIERKLVKLLSERKKLLEKLQSYRDKVAEQKKQIAELKKMSDSVVVGRDVEQLISERKDLQNKLSKLSHELPLEKTRLQEAKRSLEAKHVQVLKLQSELDQLNRSHNELQKEYTVLERKCHDQEGCIQSLEASTGQAEQRCRELERQVKGAQWRHKRGMKTIFNIVMGEGEGEGSLVDLEEEEVDVSANDSVEEEEILTVSHVTDLLREKMEQLKGTPHGSPPPVQDTATLGTQTPTRRQAAIQLAVDEQRPVDVPPSEPGPPLVQVSLPPLSITPTMMRRKVGEHGRLLVKEDQGSVSVPSSSSARSKLFGIWRLILGLLFFLVLVLGLFVTLTTMYDGRYCDEPCPSSITSLMYHAFYPYITIQHNGPPPF